MSTTNTAGVSRRNLLGATAGVAAAGAALTLGQKTYAQAAVADADDYDWDYECDILFVGAGASMMGAIDAHNAGAKVMLIEKRDVLGGDTWLCGGVIRAGGNTRAQQEAGIIDERTGEPDTLEQMYEDWFVEEAGGQADPEVVRKCVEWSPGYIDWFMDRGVTFKIFTAGVFPVGRSHQCGMEGELFAGIGKPYTDAMHAELDKLGVEYHTNTRGIHVLQDRDRKVIGVQAVDMNTGEVKYYKAKAVVLSTGGNAWNDELNARYNPETINCLSNTGAQVTSETNPRPFGTGDGHIMAMELGANMRNMNEVFNHCFNMAGEPDRYVSCNLDLDNGLTNSEQQNPIWITPGHVGSIIVNRHGERFVCEGASYDLFGRAWDAYDTGRREWRNIPGYVIVDSTFDGNFGNATPTLASMVESGEFPEWVHTFETMEDLADGMGIDKENLLHTVERWNAMCEEGVDKDWCRGEATWDMYTAGDVSRVESGELKNPSMAPLAEEGPYYCVELYPGMLSTSGGMEINGNAQVKNVRGQVIPRLYAASNCIASPMGRAYAIGGTAIVNGFVVGYVAANHIATLQPWE